MSLKSPLLLSGSMTWKLSREMATKPSKGGDTLLAENYGKLSDAHSDRMERMEDKLTGDCFGALRYLPFEIGLGVVLKEAIWLTADQGQPATFNDALSVTSGHDFKLRFWEKHSTLGEIDVLLETPTYIIGIEVKYNSLLSSDDDVSNNGDQERQQSFNQLARYAELLKSIASNRSAYLLLLAPSGVAATIARSTYERNIVAEGVTLGFLTWEDVFKATDRASKQELPIWQQLILSDIAQLLSRKGFMSFSGFDGYDKDKFVCDGLRYVFYDELNLIAWPTADIRGGDHYEFK
ncbi:hypothetical protein GTO91_17275 [Heliobacterium undosum]|uniref:Uncharacterized protein n=1 Tax=Heliomicrobium undosum TaxID=121734 RepID=A0A845L6X8_9FIRM|nr:NERD domain-containing protein [Heliomicrobium undosum]MZP31446.1 hypothetical protein [Heliomicrobium undosum]